MDTTALVGIAFIVIANIGTTIGLFMWATNHASADNKALRESTERILQEIQRDMKEFHEEMKFIHGRICSVEERVRK